MLEIFEALALACNFTYEIHYRKDGKWGTIKEYSNGTYQSSTGMFDSLINGKDHDFLNKKIGTYVYLFCNEKFREI